MSVCDFLAKPYANGAWRWRALELPWMVLGSWALWPLEPWQWFVVILCTAMLSAISEVEARNDERNAEGRDE